MEVSPNSKLNNRQRYRGKSSSAQNASSGCLHFSVNTCAPSGCRWSYVLFFVVQFPVVQASFLNAAGFCLIYIFIAADHFVYHKLISTLFRYRSPEMVHCYSARCRHVLSCYRSSRIKLM